MSQETLARAAYFNRGTLSQIELGNQDCPDDILIAIRRALEIEDLPIKESERDDYKDRLYEWYNVIGERRLNEAKELQTKLSVIKLLRHDVELNNLFSLFESRLFLGLDKLTQSKEILDAFKKNLDGLNDIQLYHYYSIQGTYNSRSNSNQKALDFYLKAYKLMKHGFEKDISLYYNIAYSYQRLGFLSRAITFIEEACTLNSLSQKNVQGFILYNFLGLSYARVGLFQRAKTLLEKAHSIANSLYKDNVNVETKAHMCLALLNYGYMFRMAKKWNRAIEYLDKSLTYIDNTSPYYLEVIYQKTRCLIQMGDILPCKDLLLKGIELSKEKESYSLLFKALKLLINLNDESAKQLETQILPYLLKNNNTSPALDYARCLRDYYRSRGRGFKTRAYMMADIIDNIRDKMHEGGVIE